MRRRSGLSRRARCCVAAAACSIAVASAWAQDEVAVFDPYMLMQEVGGPTIDTRRFQHANFAQAGMHRLDLYFNGQWRGIQVVEFRHVPGQESAVPCYDAQMLALGGLDLGKVSRADGVEPLPSTPSCEDLARYVPGAKIRVDMAQLALYVTYPDYLQKLAVSNRYVDPSQWDSGITAARINYNANVFSTQSNGQRMTRGYAGLNAGLNLGALRIRHRGSAYWSEQSGTRYQASSYYLQTDIPAWQTQLLLGESSTSGELFDAVSFRGVQLASDDRMLPETLRYYAPIVRGTANSNAKVSVYQRGFLIYETTVAPGPFAIEDVRAASYGGDLEVRVTEADGSLRSFVVPFATIVQLLRPGMTQYSLTAGRAADPGLRASSQYVMQGTLKRGIGDAVTGYGGLAFTDHYRSALLGAAISTRLGAFAADVTGARADLPLEGKRSGASYRLTYSKDLPNSGTNFSLLAYRYSTSGYVGLRDAVALGSLPAGYRYQREGRMRSRFDLNLSQTLGPRWGSLYASASASNYWAQAGGDVNFSLGYNNDWNDVSYSIALQRVHSAAAGAYWAGGSQKSTQVTVSVAIPLGASMTRRAPRLSAVYSADSRDGARLSSSVSGALDDGGAATYSVSASRNGRTSDNAIDAGVGYDYAQGTVSASMGQGAGYRQASLSATGAMLLHGGGVTLAQTLGETVALVQADNAQGARVGYGLNRVDRGGYAVVGSLSPYRLNSVDVDPADLPDDIELKASSLNVAPRAGAIVKLVYPTLRARQVLIVSTRDDGSPLPFGAQALDARSGLAVGAVGQGSRVVMRAEADQGAVRIEWGEGEQERCGIDYVLPDRQARNGGAYDVLQLPCVSLRNDGVPGGGVGPLSLR